VRGRHLTTGITLLVLVGILVLGVVLGTQYLLRPLPGSSPTATATPTCSTKTVKKGQRIAARQVQVSVFNAGSRAGLADETMNDLTGRGFTRGQVGNSPASAKVSRVQVWTNRRNDAAARLVARQFGASTKVRFLSRDLGPGVDVLVGDSFHKLTTAPRAIVVKRSQSVCLPTAGSSGAGG